MRSLRDRLPAATLAATVHRLLTAEPNLTARDMLARWPADAAPPSPQALHRHLSQAVARDEIVCTGAGHRYEPYRYRVVEAQRNANCSTEGATRG